MSLLVTGSIGIDSVQTPFGKVEGVLGGSASYFSYAASFFSPVRLVGAVGPDFPKEFLELLKSRDIDIEGLDIRPHSKTFRWGGNYTGDMNEAITTDLQLNVLAETPPTIPESFRDSDFVFLANTSPALQLDLLSQLNGPKMIVADTRDHWITENRDDLLALLPKITGLVLNDFEASILTGLDNMVAAGQSILELGPRFVVVKKGAHGCLLFEGSNICALPAYPTNKVKDPTGAGDCFAGGLMGYLASNELVSFTALRRAIGFATVVASFAIEDFSLARLQQISFDDIRARLEEFRTLSSF
ncbi:MAG: sugar kinase [Actinobacteria bacterium]|nr:sugar kinase [Actinomycetota bacterium]